MGSMIFNWVACGVSLVALVEVMHFYFDDLVDISKDVG